MNRFTHTIRNGSVLLLAMLAGTAAAEQIYRSVDAEGNVTFSNQPPANSDFYPIKSAAFLEAWIYSEC